MKAAVRLLFLLAVALLLPLSVLAETPSAPTERSWTVEGVTRQALIYVPPKAKTEKAPVVFVFHGHGGSMRNADRSFGMENQWPEAIVVYMQGLNTPGQLTDPSGLRPGWQKDKGDQNDRDLKFFDAVYASLKADYKVDESRVFATGHSNGGGFTYLLWAARGDIFRAVAPSSAAPSRGSRDLKPKPALHLAGTNDPLVRYTWQQATIARIKQVDSCDPIGKEWAKSGPLVGTEYASKTGNPVVTLIHPGGHVIPREAPALIVKFFKEVSGAK